MAEPTTTAAGGTSSSNPTGGSQAGQQPTGVPAPADQAPAATPPPDLTLDPSATPQALIDQGNRAITYYQSQNAKLLTAVGDAIAMRDKAEAGDTSTGYIDPAAANRALAQAQGAYNQNQTLIATWQQRQEQALALAQRASGRTLTQAEQQDQQATADMHASEAKLSALKLQQAQATNQTDKDALQQQIDAATRDLGQLQATHQRIINIYAGDTAAADLRAKQIQNDIDKATNDATIPELPQRAKDVTAQGTAKTAIDQANATIQQAAAAYADSVAKSGAGSAEADAAMKALDAAYHERDLIQKQTGAGLTNTGTDIANQTSQLALDQAKQWTPLANQQKYEQGAAALAGTKITNDQAALTLQHDKQGDLGTLIDQAEESIRKGLLTPMAATQQLFDKIHGSTPFQRENQASANAMQVYQTAAQQGMLGVPGQQYLNPDAAPGGGYEKAFARAGVQYTPMNISQGAQTLPAFAQSMNIPTTPAQPQAPWFSPQGGVLPAFAQGMSGGVGPDGGMLLSPDAARAMLRAGQPQAQAQAQPQMGVAA